MVEVIRWEHVEVDALAAACAELAARPTVSALLLLLGEEDLPPVADLDEVLQGLEVPVVGGVFPQVLLTAGMSPRGGVLVGLPAAVRTATVRGLSGDPARFTPQLEEALTGTDPEGRTVLVFFDATASHVDAMLGALFEQIGSLGNYLGGGAGSLSFTPQPVVVSNDGLLQDAALVAIVDVPATVGVAHGWEAVGPPLAVTGAQDRRVRSLDHRPAAEVYLERVAAHAGPQPVDDFFTLASSYPLGIVQLDGELVVRDPVVRDGDDLVLVGEVAEGAFVRLMYGDAGSLLAAAGRAADQAQDQGAQGDLAVVFDCISRVLYLGDGFDQELARLGFTPPRVGAATIGEVCNPGDRYLELYNKTVVAGLLGPRRGGADA